MHNAIKVFHGRKSMACANKVVPTYMYPSGSASHSSQRLCAILRKSCCGGFTKHRDILNLLLKGTIL